MEDYEANRNVVRKPCRQCGRQFVPESLVKHEPTCIKAAHKRRKVFDSSKQRSEGTEVTHRQIKQAQKKEVKPPKSNWRAKHEDFINTVRSARGVSLAMQRGEPLPPPPPPSINPDYVQCPYCSRRFNEKAAERHINFCKTQQQRIPNKPKADPRAAAKQNVRTQYQPPKPKTKTESSPGYGGAGTRGSPGAPVGRGRGVGGTPPSVSGRQPNSYARGRSTTTTTNTYQQTTPRIEQYFTTNQSTIQNPEFESQTSPQKTVKFSASLPPKYPSKREDLINQTNIPDDSGNTSSLINDSSSLVWAKPIAHKRTLEPLRNGHDMDSDHGDDSLFDGNGRALRTGRDGRAYQEARREIHSAGIKNSSNNRLMRGANKGTSSPGVIHYGLKESESGYYSSSSDNDHINSYTNVNQERRKNSLGKGGAKFCHECGTKYPLSEAKFCCECGVKRMALT
ncbi:zinc finger C2HC domain-containing protein 1A-like isoform X2 [Ostrea edulis]|uniref:zinc finger C2HC domain-containing protein 1A-like isoform X2 n=1 Tax=Ostrea edulis TaxID=37623 RepID=UPI00209413F8|nr:zinc finger C2HC domain-containing protein 1A-like isoform X2 [Ostrea edulis]